jgi:hypothetical protein
MRATEVVGETRATERPYCTLIHGRAPPAFQNNKNKKQ